MLNTKYFLWNGVISSFAPRVASDNAFKSQPQSPDYTIALDCLIRVLAARWRETAGAVSQKEKLKDAGVERQIFLIETDGGEERSIRNSPQA